MKPFSTATAAAAPGSAGHTRIHGSILAASEKRALVWMAGRMPARVNSDHLSALGFVSMAGVGASFWLSGSHPAVGLPLVVACLFLNWFGDSMDGTLARVRNQQRPRYGFYVDHVIDIAGTTMMLAGLAASGYMDPLVAAVTLVAWLLVMGESFLATFACRVFRMSMPGKVTAAGGLHVAPSLSEAATGRKGSPLNRRRGRAGLRAARTPTAEP